MQKIIIATNRSKEYQMAVISLFVLMGYKIWDYSRKEVSDDTPEIYVNRHGHNIFPDVVLFIGENTKYVDMHSPASNPMSLESAMKEIKEVFYIGTYKVTKEGANAKVGCQTVTLEDYKRLGKFMGWQT